MYVVGIGSPLPHYVHYLSSLCVAASGFASNSCREGVRQSQSQSIDSQKGTSSCCMGLPIEEGRGHSINFRRLKFTPGWVQRHSLKFNTLPPVTTRMWVVLETIGHCRLLYFVWVRIQCLQNCLTTPRQKFRRGGGLRKIKSCHKFLFQITFKMKRFCIAFYRSCLVPYLTGIPVLASNVQ